MKNPVLKRFIGLLCALVLCMGCALPGAHAAQADPVMTLPRLQSLNGGNAVVRTDGGRVTFVGGACTETPVANAEDAARVVEAMIPLMGGNAKTAFEPMDPLVDSFGNSYYVFQQVFAGTLVGGGAVKVVADRNGKMLGLTASIVSDLPEAEASEGISAAAAESLALQHQNAQGNGEAVLVEGMTRKIVLPVDRVPDMEAEELKSRFVWIVCTTNPASPASAEMPYLAHYVTLSGEYLYSLPTMLPGDSAGTSGYNAEYVFEFMEPVEYTGFVDWSDGTEREITVNVMRDKRTGMYYLGNLEHKIVVADCWEFLYNGGTVRLESSPDNREWDQVGLISLYNYCRASDYYKAIGWQTDGKNTPVIVLKDFCDKDHKPLDNAAYAGKFYGWQTFLSSSANDFCQCLDIVSHEFTHCVTESVMTWSAYMNDYGAINESISDIHGNLCEMLAGDTADQTWAVGEHSTEKIRNMSDPHQGSQPAFAWDLYYQPNVKDPTPANDYGGVHTDSSLLSRVACMLCRGGMALEDARAFWFAVQCSLVPGTDYAQLRDLLPWVLRNCGQEKHLETLAAALAETRLGQNGIPETVPENRTLLTLDLPDTEIFNNGRWFMTVLSVDLDTVAERFQAIGSDMSAGRTDGYPKLLVELYKSGTQAPEAPAAQPGGTGSFLDFLMELGAAAISGTPEPAPEAQAAEAQVSDAEIEEMRAWVKEQLSGIFFYGTGSAGQDGHTIRMMALAGRALPILLHMELYPNSDQIKQMNAVVFLNGRWIDLTPVLAPPEKEITLLGTLKALLKSGLVMDLIGMLLTCRTPDDYLNALTFRLPAGTAALLPADGLETVDFTANLADLDVDLEAKVNNRKSRPKE